ncbi:MAG: gliding motility-associated C-terminal domain-containing protein [Chlorobi bacterium]|nr:gliding motility-associated C-terminal domain-containing protein [Chlorobiota bacterium]
MRRYFFLSIFLLAAIAAMAQIDAGPDSTICLGETIMLQGSGPAMYTYTWTSVPDDPTISNPNILTPNVTPSVTTVYTLEGRSVSLVNLVINGDFESGNTGFTSDYVYSPGPNGIWNEGTYAITTDASYNHNNFTCDYDHTTGTGNFMAINGAGQPNVVVWSETITGIEQNTEYEFSTWVSSLSPISPAILQFKINGTLLGDPFNASSIICVWKRFFETWNSGTSNSATISIINQNTASNGNDFSLDDINFNKVTYYYDSCTVSVNDVPTSAFEMPNGICSFDTAIVNYSGTASDTAEYHWDFGSATTISGSGQGPYQLQWASSGLKSVKLWVIEACPSDTTMKTINVKQGPTAQLTADQTIIPYGTTTILHGFMDGNPGPLSFQWSPGNLLQNPSVQDPETVLLQNSSLFTFAVLDEGSQCTNEDTLTIKVTGGPLTLLSMLALPDTICLGDSTDIQLSIEGGSGNYVSTWTSMPPGFDHVGGETSLSVSPVENTTYYVEVNDGFATTPIDSVKIVVLAQVSITLNPRDTLVETGQTAIFKVDGLYNTSFQWQLSIDNGISWANIGDDATYSGTLTNTLTVSDVDSGMNLYQYRCLLEGKCMPATSSSAVLKVVKSPAFIAETTSAAVCVSDSLSIACSVYSFIAIDSLYLMFTYDGSLLQFNDIGDVRSELSSLEYSSSNDSIYVWWSENGGKSIDSGFIFKMNFVAKQAGQSDVGFLPKSVVRNKFGFYPDLILSSGSIVINPLPQMPSSLTATPDSLNILDELYIDLEAFGGSGDEIIWTTDSCNGIQIGKQTALNIFRPESTTVYFARWTNQCGESICDSVKVKITEQFIFAVPNAFSPDGDGKNDDFGVITVSKLGFFDMKIFNRWGQLIFSTNDQNEHWDGSLDGKTVPLGTYVWKVNYQFRIEGPGSDPHEESGTVTLLR